MKLSVYEVSLLGADERGRFIADCRVLASSEQEAEAMARASAALRDFAVIDVARMTLMEAGAEPTFEFPRVLGHGERNYAAGG